MVLYSSMHTKFQFSLQLYVTLSHRGLADSELILKKATEEILLELYAHAYLFY